MRSFRFRIWNKNKKHWHQYGFNLIGETILLGYIDHDSIDNKHVPLVELDDLIINQFIGITDKNGKEIYEGDIINGFLFYDNSTLPTKGLVKYNKEFAAFCLKNEGGETLFHNHEISSFEIIGNIFENPELLKGIDL
jgi:uncharacterized phage protein (TIGR01671 family)